MSVPNQTPYNIYTANGLTTVFAYEFYLISASDIQVTINGNEVTSGYTVSGVGNQDGGDVTFQTPPADGSLVMLERVVPTYRLTDYQDNGDLLADTVNKDFDRIWMAIQRVFINLGFALTRPFLGGPFNAKGYRIENLADPVNEQDAATKKYVADQGNVNLVRTLRVPEVSVNPLYPISGRKNSLLGFNSSGNPVPIFAQTETADLAIKLASNEVSLGASLIGTVDGITVQQYIDAVSHISILEYIPPSKWKYLNDPAIAEANIGDLHDIIMKAQKDAAISGKPLVFCGPKATYLEGVTSSQNFFFPTSPVEWVEGCAILATGHGKCRLVPVAATPANTFIFTIPPAKGKPRIVIDGLGFTATNYRDKNVGGFTFKRGCYTSDIRNIFIQDCYYGGFVIKPENPAGQTAAEDIVNLNIDNIMIVNSGTQGAYQAFDLQFSTEWGSGNWTDGAVRNIDISTAFADNTTIATAPISLNIYNFGKQIFNVLFERWYTSAKAATHVKVYSNSDIRNTNLTFRNFSGDGIVKTSDPMIDINGLGWSHLEDVYRGSLINGGLRVAIAQNVTFSNMVFGASTDAAGNYVPQLRVLSTAVDTKFQNCTIRNPFGTSAPYNYRKWFTDWIIDAGVNTQWDGPQFKSDVIVQRSFDFFNTVASNKCTNASSQNVDMKAVQTDSYLQLTYPATTRAASPTINFPLPLNLRQGVAGDDYVYVMLKVSCSSASIGIHRLSINLFDTEIRWAPESTGADVFILGKFPVNSAAANTGFKLGLDSPAATTNDFILQLKEIAITSGALPWAPNYRKTLQVM